MFYLKFSYLASEQTSGSLEDLVHKNCEEIYDWRSIIHQITKGIEYLHLKEKCHCDLKPSNILVTFPTVKSGPQMKVANFGITRIIKDSSPFALWKIAGSKDWMAPEIYDKIRFTRSVDIFSLGAVIAFILSSGTHPFGSSREEQILRIQRKEMMTLTLKQIKLPEEEATGIFTLIHSMLSVDPEQRPSIETVLQAQYFYQVNGKPLIEGKCNYLTKSYYYQHNYN